MRKRFKQGHAEYGDRVYNKHPIALAMEIQEEADDIAGWGSIMSDRMESLIKELARESTPRSLPELPIGETVRQAEIELLRETQQCRVFYLHRERLTRALHDIIASTEEPKTRQIAEIALEEVRSLEG
jgi:hypothetical protein